MVSNGALPSLKLNECGLSNNAGITVVNEYGFPSNSDDIIHSSGATSAFSTASMMISLPFATVAQQQQHTLAQSQQFNSDSYMPVCSIASLPESAFLTFPESMDVSANTGFLNGQQSNDQGLGAWTSAADMIKVEPYTFPNSPVSESSVFTPIAGPSSLHFFNGTGKELKLEQQQQRCASAIEFYKLVPEAGEISTPEEHEGGQKKQKKKAQKQKLRRFSAMDTAELAIVMENIEGTFN